MRNKDAKIIGIWGRRGSGKSTRAKQLLKNKKRVIVFDVMQEYEEDLGYKGVKSKLELLETLKSNSKSFKIAWLPKSDYIKSLKELCDLILKIQLPYKNNQNQLKLTLVVEEMSLCVPNSQKPDVRKFLSLCNIGRHYGIEIIGISQRMAEVHTTFRGNTAEDYFFALRSANDKKNALALIGKEYTYMLNELTTHNAIYFSNGTAKKMRNKI